MTSGKFCCKPCWPLIRKDLTRFWPVWAGYLAIWTLILPVGLLNTFSDGESIETLARQSEWARQKILTSAQTTGLLIAFACGLLCAMAVWSYLTSARSVSLHHALPVTRESAFVSHWLSGLMFTLLPNCILALVSYLCAAAAGCPGLGRVLLYWLGAVCLQQLLFFAIGTFTAMLTGSLPALAVLYLLVNLGVYVCEALAQNIAVRFLPGINDLPLYLTGLSPLVRLLSTGNAYWNPESASPWAGLQYPLLLIYGGVALVLSLLSLLLYRRRASESAGDVVAVPVLRPVLQVCFALGCSLTLGWMLWLLLFQLAAEPVCLLVSLLLGGGIGWFAAAMLLKKSFRVFDKKQWLGMAALALAIVLAVLALWGDLFGVVRQIPEAAEVAELRLSSEEYTLLLTEPDELEQAETLHRILLAQEKASAQSEFRRQVGLSYTLKDGSTLERSYTLGWERAALEREDSAISRLAALLARPEARAAGMLPEDEPVSSMEFSLGSGDDLILTFPNGDSQYSWGTVTDVHQLKELKAALRQDILENGLGSWQPEEDKPCLMYIYLFGNGVQSVAAYDRSQLTETLKVLEQFGYVKGENHYE